MAIRTGGTMDRRVAAVLSGGGALGAYEAGVLEYALDTLSQDRALSRVPRFDILSGTSVGALNASYLAAAAREPARAGRALGAFWRSLTFNEVLRFGGNELGSAVRLLLGAKPGRQHHHRCARRLRAVPHEPVAGLFDTTPLRRVMSAFVPWNSLADNLAQSAVQGIALCATEICTGQSVIFYQTAPSTKYRPGTDPTKVARRVSIGPEHAMASASIPFLFPAVQIEGVCYTDGALRQNTPLNPALRMGADRVLVVSVSQTPEVASGVARLGCRRNPFPGALFLLGKTVSILLSQSLDYELRRVEMYNRLLSGGAQIYGEGFAEQVNAIMGSLRNASYRTIQTCHVRPSQSIHELALDALERAPNEVEIPGLPGKVISRFLRSSVFAESELLETLMFTPTFVRSLVELGYRDAQAQHDELVALFAE